MFRPGNTRSIRSLLVCAVALIALLLPATLFAQSEDLVGVYVSDPVTGVDEPSEGAVVTFVLFDDGTLEAMTDLPESGTVVFEQGAWEDDGEGLVTAVFLTRDGEPYEEPVELDLVSDGESLAAPELEAYGADGLVLFLTDVEPVSMAEDHGLEATADVVAAAMGDDGPAGYYMSEIAWEGDVSFAILAHLAEDGSLQVVFVAFDGTSAPSSSIGSWTVTEAGQIAATLEQDIVGAGEDAELVPSEDVETVEFDLVDGVLVSEDFSLYPLDNIAGEVAHEDDAAPTVTFATSAEEQEAGNTVVFDVSMDGTLMVTVVRPEEDIDVTLAGAWEQTEDEIAIVLDSDADGNELEEPLELLLIEHDDGTVEGVEFDTELFGETLVVELVEE